MKPAEWQIPILERYRQHPGESVEARASALGMTPSYLNMLVNTDAFRSLLGANGLNGEVAGVDLELRETGHLFQTPPELEENALQEVGREAFGEVEKFSGQKKLHYTHDALIDEVIRNPSVTKTQLAALFGFSKPWMSRIFASSAFKEAMEKRKQEIINPALVATVEETFNSLVAAASDVIHERIANGDVKTSLQALDISAKFLGAGQRQPQIAVNNYVAVVPPKLQNAEEWSKQYQSRVSIHGEKA